MSVSRSATTGGRPSSPASQSPHARKLRRILPPVLADAARAGSARPPRTGSAALTPRAPAPRSPRRRQARDKIELSEQEREVLEPRARAEKLPFQDVQRARIVLYAAEGLADTEIAARLDTSPGLVGRWRRRFAEQRLDGLKD